MHNQQLYNLHSLSHIITLIKNRRIRCEATEERMGHLRNASFWSENKAMI